MLANTRGWVKQMSNTAPLFTRSDRRSAPTSWLNSMPARSPSACSNSSTLARKLPRRSALKMPLSGRKPASSSLSFSGWVSVSGRTPRFASASCMAALPTQQGRCRVDDDLGPGDVRAVVRREKDNQLRNLVRRGRAAVERGEQRGQTHPVGNRLQITPIGARTDIRAHASGQDHIDPDAPQRELDGSHLAEGHLTGFGCGVARVPWQPEKARAIDRRRDDDRATAGRSQVGNAVLHGQEGAGEVGVECRVPLLQGHLLDWTLHAVDARVGEHHVQPTKGLDGPGDRGLYLL